MDAIILYGSFARGEASSGSDIDILVIGKTDVTGERFLKLLMT
ncbi:MAG TPA: nucleotidyltransferase domain-containing protein [Archaeoglobus sp.]|nr:nucleotidyltransferase domain-containing protein [Archaeoglobus sp.]